MKDKTVPEPIGNIDSRKARNPITNGSPGRLEKASFQNNTYTLRFSHGKPLTVDLTKNLPTKLANEISYVIWMESRPLRQLTTRGPARAAYSIGRIFLQYLEAQGIFKEVSDLQAVSPKVLDEFENWMRSQTGKKKGWSFRRMADLRRLLLLAEHYNLISEDCAIRLSYISADPSDPHSSTPRDAYSPFVAAQIRKAALAEYEAIVRRIEVEGPGLAASGKNPMEKMDWSDQNIAWVIRNGGVATFSSLKILYRERKKTKSGIMRWEAIRSMFHLNMYDAFCLCCLISLLTGIPIESVKELRIDCLVNEARGYIDIRYIKRRSGKITEKTKRVRCGEVYSPGSILKKIIEITALSRSLTSRDADFLFVGCAGRKHNGTYFSLLHPRRGGGKAFCRKHGIRNDDGSLVGSIQLVRMRKTYKAQAYRGVAGHLADAADDHSPKVFANHYGNVPALRHHHEQTIAEGLHDAYAAAMEPMVLDGDQEIELMDDPVAYADARGLDREEMVHVASGDADVWLASCRNPSTSPYGTDEDDSCISPIIGCLGCRNAVITLSHLPAILSLVDHILKRRGGLRLDVWKARYDKAYRRIMLGVLPRFTKENLAWARKVAEEEENLLWLPAELLVA